MIELIEKNLYRFNFRFYDSNCYLFLGDKITLIDSSHAKNSEMLEQHLKELSLSPKDIELILHTHGHTDHFSGNKIFPKAETWMSKYDGTRVNEKDEHFTFYFFSKEEFQPFIQDFFVQGQEFDLGAFNLKVLFTPGHTKGSVCFFDKEKKLLFSGDTVFDHAVGRTDLVSGSKKDLINSIKSLQKPGFSMLLPGHGLVVKEKEKNQENLAFCLELLE